MNLQLEQEMENVHLRCLTDNIRNHEGGILTKIMHDKFRDNLSSCIVTCRTRLSSKRVLFIIKLLDDVEFTFKIDTKSGFGKDILYNQEHLYCDTYEVILGSFTEIMFIKDFINNYCHMKYRNIKSART